MMLDEIEVGASLKSMWHRRTSESISRKGWEQT